MEQQNGSKLGNEYSKAVYHHPAYLTLCTAQCIMRNAKLDESQARNKTVGKNINNLRCANDTTLVAEQSVTKESLEGERRGKKLASNSTFKELKS